MGKYSQLEADVFSVFNSPDWKSESINSYPANFTPKEPGEEFIRVDIVPSGAGLNSQSLSGLLIVDIFSAAGRGPKRSSQIADMLDTFLQQKSLQTESGKLTQFFGSSLQYVGLDKENPSLYRAKYSIPLKFYGV